MPIRHTVEQGECITSIAGEYGLFWETIWNHPDNADLKRLRQDPNVLAPGDVVVVPDKQIKQESGSTEKRHRYRLKAVPAKVKVRVLFDDEPRANQTCQICVEGRWQKGATDGDGFLEFPVPPGAREAGIMIDQGDCQEFIELQLGQVDPLDSGSGAVVRLQNLGYDTTDPTSAIRAFQATESLQVTGAMDSPTKARLKERFGQ